MAKIVGLEMIPDKLSSQVACSILGHGNMLTPNDGSLLAAICDRCGQKVRVIWYNVGGQLSKVKWAE